MNQGENCDTIASKNGVPLNDFLTWNPKAGQKCTGLWADTYACVSVIGYKPPATSTMPSNGVQTPVPTQPGMVSNCNKFVFVKTDDSCASIASKAAISTSDFLKWNPQVGGQCKGLWANAYACVGVLSAFRLKTRYHADCTGDVHNDVSVSGAGICINTDCKVASLEVATEGYCQMARSKLATGSSLVAQVNGLDMVTPIGGNAVVCGQRVGSLRLFT